MIQNPKGFSNRKNGELGRREAGNVAHSVSKFHQQEKGEQTSKSHDRRKLTQPRHPPYIWRLTEKNRIQKKEKAIIFSFPCCLAARSSHETRICRNSGTEHPALKDIDRRGRPWGQRARIPKLRATKHDRGYQRYSTRIQPFRDVYREEGGRHTMFTLRATACRGLRGDQSNVILVLSRPRWSTHARSWAGRGTGRAGFCSMSARGEDS